MNYPDNPSGQAILYDFAKSFIESHASHCRGGFLNTLGLKSITLPPRGGAPRKKLRQNVESEMR